MSRTKQEVVEYRMAHYRLGKAAEKDCVDCGSRAGEWSLNHGADTLVSQAPSSAGKEYSLNTDDYSPRCRACHRKYDGIDFLPGNRRNNAA